MERFPLEVAPDWGLSTGVEANVVSTKFGDGYEMRRPAGLNHMKESWSPRWSELSPAEADSAYLWLRSRLKLNAFLWKHPVDGRDRKIICTEVSKSDDTFGVCALSATFVEDHNPA